MNKKNLGLSFKQKFITGTITRFIHNGRLENKKIRTEEFPAAPQPEEILDNAFGTCHCHTCDTQPKQWQEPSLRTEASNKISAKI